MSDEVSYALSRMTSAARQARAVTGPLRFCRILGLAMLPVAKITSAWRGPPADRCGWGPALRPLGAAIPDVPRSRPGTSVRGSAEDRHVSCPLTRIRHNPQRHLW